LYRAQRLTTKLKLRHGSRQVGRGVLVNYPLQVVTEVMCVFSWRLKVSNVLDSLIVTLNSIQAETHIHSQGALYAKCSITRGSINSEILNSLILSPQKKQTKINDNNANDDKQ